MRQEVIAMRDGKNEIKKETAGLKIKRLRGGKRESKEEKESKKRDKREVKKKRKERKR